MLYLRKYFEQILNTSEIKFKSINFIFSPIDQFKVTSSCEPILFSTCLKGAVSSVLF